MYCIYRENDGGIMLLCEGLDDMKLSRLRNSKYGVVLRRKMSHNLWPLSLGGGKLKKKKKKGDSTTEILLELPFIYMLVDTRTTSDVASHKRSLGAGAFWTPFP